MDGETPSLIRPLIAFALFAIGFTGCFLAVRRDWGVWRAGIWSFLGGVLLVWFVDNGLEAATERDYWGPPARVRFTSTPAGHLPDGAVVPFGDWDGDAVPERLLSRCIADDHFYSNTTYSRIEVMAGSDGRVLGTLEFHVPFAAVPRACGDLDGDGVAEFAVDYLGETFVWGRESFL